MLFLVDFLAHDRGGSSEQLFNGDPGPLGLSGWLLKAASWAADSWKQVPSWNRQFGLAQSSFCCDLVNPRYYYSHFLTVVFPVLKSLDRTSREWRAGGFVSTEQSLLPASSTLAVRVAQDATWDEQMETATQTFGQLFLFGKRNKYSEYINLNLDFHFSKPVN